MAYIIPGSTDVLEFEITMDAEIPTTDRIWVSIRAGGVQLDKTGEDLIVEDNVVSMKLTQAESLRLRDNVTAEGQINILLPDALGEDNRVPSDPFTFEVGKQILRKVISV